MSPMNNLGKRFAFIIDASGRQADLAFTYWRTGTRLARSDAQSKKDARTMVEKRRDILRALKTRTGLTRQQQQWLDSIEADLRKW